MRTVTVRTPRRTFVNSSRIACNVFGLYVLGRGAESTASSSGASPLVVPSITVAALWSFGSLREKFYGYADAK